MKGDFTRNTFRKEKHYAGVLMQQGRVQLDSDWNEAMAILEHRSQTQTRDLLGHCGAPEGNAAFGILTQNGPAPANLPPAQQALLKKLMDDLGPDDFLLTPGRFYADGILCELEQFMAYSGQVGTPQLKTPGLYLIYLDLWERHMTALEDPAIREVALGGPDTATRFKYEWRVSALELAEDEKLPATCSSAFPAWEKLTGPTKAGLSARSRPGKTSPDPCIVAASAGYRRLENQLYRVEIHAGEKFGKATYKWSRENGSVLLKVDAVILPNVIAVSAPGRAIGELVATGQWLELIDEERELLNQPGALVKVDQVGDDRLTLSLGSTSLADFDSATLRARRWEGTGVVEHGAAADQGYLPLESGVEVKFAAGGAEYRTGDYWLIPARTLTADVEWAKEPDGDPVVEPPMGRHHYCRLALVRRHQEEEGVELVSECRPTFTPMGERRFRIHRVQIQRDDRSLGFNEALSIADLEEGIAIHCDRPIGGPGQEHLDRVVYVTVNLPYAVDAAIGYLIGRALFPESRTPTPPPGTPTIPAGERPTIHSLLSRELLTSGRLAAEQPSAIWERAQVEIPNMGYKQVLLAGSVWYENETLVWNGIDLKRTFAIYFTLLRQLKLEPTLWVQLTVKGNAIWAADAPETHLDAEGYLTAADEAGNLKLPTGNGRQGGDLELWFTVSPSDPD